MPNIHLAKNSLVWDVTPGIPTWTNQKVFSCHMTSHLRGTQVFPWWFSPYPHILSSKIPVMTHWPYHILKRTIHQCHNQNTFLTVTARDFKYSLFTLRKTRSPLRINGERGFVRVNRLCMWVEAFLSDPPSINVPVHFWKTAPPPATPPK